VSVARAPAAAAAPPARRTFDGRDRFAAFAAHELRAPVALQRALVEVTLADPGADAAALREMGERVLAACEHQQRLIDALLDLARGRRRLRRRESVDLAAITGEALRAHDLSGFDTVVALEPARTTGDPDLLARLGANLVSNAVRHNVVGGRIEVATRAEPGLAVISVANTGSPFRAADGAGLGLVIVHAIADAHDAVVTAQPRPDGGLRIEIRFPGGPERMRV
jgi:signal transduction histidine kinase